MKGMSLTRTRLRAAVRVMRYYNSVPLTGAMPVMALLGTVQTTSLLVVMIMACIAILGVLVKTLSYRFSCSCFLRRASSREKGQPQNSCRYSPYSLESAMERL